MNFKSVLTVLSLVIAASAAQAQDFAIPAPAQLSFSQKFSAARSKACKGLSWVARHVQPLTTEGEQDHQILCGGVILSQPNRVDAIRRLEEGLLEVDRQTSDAQTLNYLVGVYSGLNDVLMSVIANDGENESSYVDQAMSRPVQK